MADALAVVKRATRRRVESEEAWRVAVRAAVSQGYSLRQVAYVANISHVRVLQIVRGE